MYEELKQVQKALCEASALMGGGAVRDIIEAQIGALGGICRTVHEMEVLLSGFEEAGISQGEEGGA